MQHKCTFQLNTSFACSVFDFGFIYINIDFFRTYELHHLIFNFNQIFPYLVFTYLTVTLTFRNFVAAVPL